MSNAIVEKSPAMNREFLEDVVSIKVAETETLLEDKLKELVEAEKEQGKVCGKAIKSLQDQCKADAEEQVGAKVKAAVAAINATEIFPEMDYHIGEGYGVAVDKTKDEEKGIEERKKLEEYGVHVEIAIKQDEKALKIARGGLPITTTTQGSTRTGAKIIAATTALIKVTPSVTELQTRLDGENEKRATLNKQIDKIREYLRNMNSSERKIRAAVARNHLGTSDEGKRAIEFLESIGLPQALGKDVAKALPDLVTAQ